jgi:hypothetical protein
MAKTVLLALVVAFGIAIGPMAPSSAGVPAAGVAVISGDQRADSPSGPCSEVCWGDPQGPTRPAVSSS